MSQQNQQLRVPLLGILLVIANAMSIGGDVLFAFWWNSKLILDHPSAGLTSLGIVSLLGIVGGLFLAPRLSKMKNQALILGVGSIIRMLAVLIVAFALLSVDRSWILPIALGVQLLDLIVSTLTAGAIFTLLAEIVPKEKFTQSTGINQLSIQLGIIGSWALGGLLLTYVGEFGLLVVDVLSFLPVSIFLIWWSRRVTTAQLIKNTSQSVSEHTSSFSSTQTLSMLIPLALIFLLGSLVNRTTPVLWQDKFVDSNLPVDTMFGLLFAIYVSGYMLASTLAATQKGSGFIKQRIEHKGTLPILVSLLGTALLLLPFTHFHASLFIIDLFLAGLFGGLISPIYMTKIRNSFENDDLRKMFYYAGLIGRYGDPIGNGIAGILLLFLSISGLYLFSGIGLALTALLILATQTKGSDKADERI